MIQTLIFDLSEVLIAGLLGIEEPLATRLNIDAKAILPAFAGQPLHELFCGRLSEDQYLTQLVQHQQWHISLDSLKRIIRENFHRRVPGMVELLPRLEQQYELILLSDHAVEWVDYIHTFHPFLHLFKTQFFSFELNQTKQEPSTFQKVLRALDRQPEQCLVVDDSAKNLSAAATVGLPGIHFTTAETLVSEFVSRGILNANILS